MKHDKEGKQASIISSLLVGDALTLNQKKLQALLRCDVHTATLRCWLLPHLSLLLVPFLSRLLTLRLLVQAVSLPM